MSSPLRSRVLVLPLIVALMIGAMGGVLRASAQDSVEITYFTFSAAPDHLEDLDQMIAAFEAANPGIKVKVETAPFDQYFTKLQTLDRGRRSARRVRAQLRELRLLRQQRGAARSDAAGGSRPGHSPSGSTRGRTRRSAGTASSTGCRRVSRTWCSSTTRICSTRRAWRYPTADWTWKEEIEAAQKLTDADEGDLGRCTAPSSSGSSTRRRRRTAAASSAPDGTTVTINEPGCVEALQFMVDKINKEKVAPTDADMAGVSDGDLFKQGKIAMLRRESGCSPGFQDAPFNWDIALEPGNTQKAHHFFANGVAISAATDHQQEAWQWAQFFTSSPEAAQIRVAASWELPALNDQALFDGLAGDHTAGIAGGRLRGARHAGDTAGDRAAESDAGRGQRVAGRGQERGDHPAGGARSGEDGD